MWRDPAHPWGRVGGIFRFLQNLRSRQARPRGRAARLDASLYRDLIESFPVGFALAEVLLDEQEKPYDYRTLEANEAFCRLIGFPREAVIGRTVAEAAPGVRPFALEELGRVALGGEPAHFDRYSEGMGRWFEVYASRSSPGRFAALLIDISAQKQAEEALRQLTATLESRVAERTREAESRARQLQALTLQLTEVEEKERRRIGGLLHDELQQVLAGAHYRLVLARQAAGDRAALEPLLRQADELLGQSAEMARSLSHELSPTVLYRSGLPDAVSWLARQMKARHGLTVHLEVAGWTPLREELLQVVLYRAIQELLFNAVKHAGVNTVWVRLRRTGSTVEVEVEDRGKGFDPALAARNLGLFGIQERLDSLGGRLAIDSAPGRGSRFTLIVPIPG